MDYRFFLATNDWSRLKLEGYAVHPAHVAVANGKVRPFSETRLCLDYEDR